MRISHRLITLLLMVILIVGCAEGQKRFTESEVNALAMQSHVRNRTSRALQTMRALEELRGGAVSNAVEILESSLDSDLEQLRTVLQQADIPDQYRVQAQSTVSRLQEYRGHYPRETERK